MKTLEDRVAELEASRYRQIGAINASNHLLMDLWLNYLEAKVDNVPAAMDALRKSWLKNASVSKSFPGVDPVHIEVAHQEYVEALDLLAKEMIGRASLIPPGKS